MMIRKLMASSALLALMSTGAITIAQAQDNSTANPPVVQEEPAAATQPAVEEEATGAASTDVASDAVLTPEEPTFATSFIGRSVYSSEDPESDNIGDVNDLIVSEDGTITHAVVGVGGFLGIGEKDVAVPFDELQVVETDGDIKLIYAATREQLEAAPAMDRTAYDPAARAQEETAALDAQSTDTMAPVPAESSSDMTATTEPAAPAEEMAATDEAAEPAPAEAVAEAPSTDQSAAPAEDMAATETAPAEDMTAQPADDTAVVGDTAPASGELGFVTVSAGQIEASDLMGQSVTGADNESIGEISDLILEEEGKTRVALIDVGGFLGVGEKTVGIPFEELTITKAEDGSELVSVAMSREQLEQLPAIEIDTAAVDATAPADATPPVEEVPADQAAAPVDPAMPSEEPADVAEVPAASDDMTTGSIATDYSLATQDIAASELIGASVYGPDDASIGEVSDVVFAQNGDIEGIIIDVGGFLGMGEKPVAVDFDSLNVRTDENGTVTAMIDATTEQFESAPTYEPIEDTAAAQ